MTPITRERSQKKINRKGFTLVEVLFSVFIAILVLAGVVEAMVYLTALTSSSKNRALVFQDAQMTMERIMGTQFSSITTTFSNGQTLPSTSGSFVANVLRGYKLPSETIAVSYPGGTAANPLEILVTGQWTENGRPQSLALRTFRRG